MTDAYIDTDVLIRLLTGDDLGKQQASALLFQRVQDGNLTVAAPDTVIADAVYVLSSPRLYHVPRAEVAAMLTALVRLPGFRVDNRRVVLRALSLYSSVNVDFGDAMIVAAMQLSGGTQLYFYDADFDGIQGVDRIEP